MNQRKRNETKRNQQKRNETKSTKWKRNKTKPTKAKRNKRKQNEIDWYEENGITGSYHYNQKPSDTGTNHRLT
jgi:hypothetical protein